MQGSPGVAPAFCHLGRLVQDKQILEEMWYDVDARAFNWVILIFMSEQTHDDDDEPVL